MSAPERPMDPQIPGSTIPVQPRKTEEYFGHSYVIHYHGARMLSIKTGPEIGKASPTGNTITI